MYVPWKFVAVEGAERKMGKGFPKGIGSKKRSFWSEKSKVMETVSREISVVMADYCSEDEHCEISKANKKSLGEKGIKRKKEESGLSKKNLRVWLKLPYGKCVIIELRETCREFRVQRVSGKRRRGGVASRAEERVKGRGKGWRGQGAGHIGKRRSTRGGGRGENTNRLKI